VIPEGSRDITHRFTYADTTNDGMGAASTVGDGGGLTGAAAWDFDPTEDQWRKPALKGWQNEKVDIRGIGNGIRNRFSSRTRNV
jgi:hypothetical protein